ncbi:spinster family MFS transporter [Salaquimonas pukyongi]|uniref:spinster family MFS transporter n=1 Tax=Salaquimonas pukyongi TaxID=2712698 RepID=UPI001FCDB8CF|nr:MFS transporter [Salaquimonas pukyongi]
MQKGRNTKTGGNFIKADKRYALFILAAIFAVAHLDRHVLGISLDAIGKEFALSDSQLGFLSGFVFAVVFVVAGFPIAWLAARGSRRNIVAASATLWSVLTILTASAQNFLHLIIARIGVGIGEAGAVAPAHSMISDLYPPDRRTSALATFTTGANIGVLLAFLIGGIAGQALGWRWAFVIAGMPGLLLAVLLRFTVGEPMRASDKTVSSKPSTLFASSLKTIWDDQGLFHAMMGLALTGIVTFGALAWTPAFIIRAHGLGQAQTGVYLALSIGIIGGIGTWLSGRLADRLGANNAKWRIGIVIVAILAAKPLIWGFLLIGNTRLALTLYTIALTMGAVFWGPTFAFLHSRVANEMRPMATAIYLFAFNLIGVGIGPTVVGFASSNVFHGFGTHSLGISMAAIHLAGLWGLWHYWKAMQTIN